MKENFKHEIIGDEQSHSFKFNNLEPFTDSESDSESETEEESMEPVHFLPEGRKRQEEQEKSLRKPNNKEKSAKKTQSISDFKPSQLLLKAARRGRLDLVTYVLDMDGSLIDACDGDGYTALHRASYEGHEDVVRTLLLRGADVSALTLDGWQPLHCACRWGKVRAAAFIALGWVTNLISRPIFFLISLPNGQIPFPLVEFGHFSPSQ